MLHVDDAARVRLVTLDRPEARNALDTEHYHGLADALDGAAAAADLAVVVITGTAGAFCAGQDLAEMGRLATTGTTTEARTGHGFQRFISTLGAFPKPVVAAVNGLAVGLGVTMLPYCDLVLAAADARFRTPFVSLGVVPEAGSSFTLPTLLGPQAAAHTLLTGEWLDASDARACRLVWRVCPADQLLDEALGLARAVARMPLVSLVETKRLLRTGWTDAAAAARGREEEVFARLTGGPANREAIAAFFEKREPDFTNLAPE
jgi:enoyl-CoA hydratase/carnithine racemase